jgi:putative resolvase
MNEKLYSPRELASILKVSTETLKYWENTGQIKATKTKGGHRRYHYSVPTISHDPSRKKYVYARVSSIKQKHDLERQVDALKAAYPNHEVIQDIGSGINFRRKGLIALLDRVLAGGVAEVVVAHRDRLVRFGWELFELLFERFETVLTVVSDSDIQEPTAELAKDLLSVVTVFTARYYGSRSYKLLQKSKVLSHGTASAVPKQVPRRIKVFLQPSRQFAKRKRRQGIAEAGGSAATGHDQ